MQQNVVPLQILHFALYIVFLQGTPDNGLRTETYLIWVDIKYKLCWTEHIELFIWV
jgi:hypothetical protein